MKLAFITSLLAVMLATGCASTGRRQMTTAVPHEFKPMPVTRIFFPTAARAANSREASKVSENARWMVDNPDEILVLAGHCDERGPADFNMELGDRRARWVMGRMMDEGVDPARLIVISKGESSPADKGHGPRAWANNRRVEFIRR